MMRRSKGNIFVADFELLTVSLKVRGERNVQPS
jgi:hypothetical protein